MKTLQLTIIAILFTQCTSISSEIEDSNTWLEPVGNAQFPIDNLTSYRTTFLRNHEEKLVFLNSSKPSILVFDIPSRELVKEISLEKEGPNGVGSPSGLAFNSLNSFYVISSTRYQVSLIDSIGNSLKKYTTLPKNEKYGENTGMIRPFTISPPVIHEDNLYFSVVPDRNVYSAEIFEGNTNLVLNIEEDSISYFNSYPNEFKGNVWGVNATDHSSIFVDGNFVYSFAISDSLSVYNINSETTKRYLAKSVHSKKRIQPMPKPSNEHDLQYVLETFQYSGIIYDQYRKVYYRFVKHPLDYKNERGEINNFHSKPISVIILDDDFRVIGETMLENNKFTTSMYFVSEEGLFISDANPLNIAVDENYAGFTLFNLRLEQ